MLDLYNQMFYFDRMDFPDGGDSSIAYFNYLLNFEALSYATIALAIAFSAVKNPFRTGYFTMVNIRFTYSVKLSNTFYPW